jgi:hypothetical protein
MVKPYLISTIYNSIRTLNYFLKFIYNKNSFFQKTGFIISYIKGIPLDEAGKPVPWMNYAILDFFNKKLHKQITVFEFGSGFSTIFFSEKVQHITSVEISETWYKKASEITYEKNNVSIIYRGDITTYTEAIIETGKRYNMIVVDGCERVMCAKNAYRHLTDDGVLILDDSDRAEYRYIWEYCFDKGFRELTFIGLKPTGFSIDSTTIFYRSNNILSI